jgi:hypothetical protein
MIPCSTNSRRPATDLSRRRTRVLIVEDTQPLAESYQLLLGLSGYEVRVAYTGPEGVYLGGVHPCPPDFGCPAHIARLSMTRLGHCYRLRRGRDMN